MPLGLKRYQQEGDDHFITISCYRREAYFATPDSKDIFLYSLELTRRRYCRLSDDKTVVKNRAPRFLDMGHAAEAWRNHFRIADQPEITNLKRLSAHLKITRRGSRAKSV